MCLFGLDSLYLFSCSSVWWQSVGECSTRVNGRECNSCSAATDYLSSSLFRFSKSPFPLLNMSFFLFLCMPEPMKPTCRSPHWKLAIMHGRISIGSVSQQPTVCLGLTLVLCNALHSWLWYATLVSFCMKYMTLHWDPIPVTQCLPFGNNLPAK